MTSRRCTLNIHFHRLSIKWPLPRPHRRPWFRFSLGTMFLVAAVVAVFVAYHVNWIRQRREVLDQAVGFRWYSHGEPPRAPFMLRVFGEYGFDHIRIRFFSDDVQDQIEGGPFTAEQEADLLRVKRLFPEATSVQSVISNPVYRETEPVDPSDRMWVR